MKCIGCDEKRKRFENNTGGTKILLNGKVFLSYVFVDLKGKNVGICDKCCDEVIKILRTK